MSEKMTDLTGQMLLFGLLSKILYMPPKKEWIQPLVDDDVFSLSPFAENQADVKQGLKFIQSWLTIAWEQDNLLALDDLETDYMRLFIGVDKVLAPPWESVFFNEDRSMFTENTLQVREWYHKYGLQIEQLHHEPDDHIGLELSFLAYLSQITLQAAEQQNQSRLTRLLDDQHTFLIEHPLRWSQDWCDLVFQNAHTDFYRGVALLVNGALKESELFLRDALTQVSDGAATI